MRLTRWGVRGATALVLVGVCSCGGGGGTSNETSLNPVLGTTSFSTNENVPLKGNLTATDPSNLAVTFTQGGNATSGTVSGFTSAGAFVYTPNANFTGNDSFAVTATDSAGHATSGTVSITVAVDQPPVVGNTIVSAQGASQASTLAHINVLANASSPTKESLTVALTPNSTLLGTASINSDQTVSITDLPANFEGLTRFSYTVTDQSGKSASATAAVFVGTAAFRAAFVADSVGDGSNEVYLTDFAGSPVKESAATQGTVRLQGFAISENGATIVYRTQDSANTAATSLAFVQTASPGKAVGIALPTGAAPIQDGSGKDQFIVSPDGNWIALIAGQGASNSLYVLNVGTPATVSQVQPTIAGTAASYATQPAFTSDSKTLYFLASSDGTGAHRSLFFTSVTGGSPPTTPTLASALSDPGSDDEIYAYSVAPDQSNIVEQANRAGRVGIFLITAPHWTVESQINQPPATGYQITTSTVGLAPGFGGSWAGTQVAYDVGDSSVSDSVGGYVASLAATPQPQLLAPLDQVIGFSPPVGNAADTYLLYTDGAGLFDIDTSGVGPGTQVGYGSSGWYDPTGSIVLLQKAATGGGVTLSYNIRPFGTPQPVISNGVAYDVDVSGFGGRPGFGGAPVFGGGVILLGSGPSSGTAPSTVNLQLVNALAPAAPFPLSSYPSPVQLSSYVSRIVSQ